MAMPDGCRRFIDELAPRLEKSDKDVDVLAAAGSGPSAQRRIETVQGTQGRRPEGDVGARPEIPRRVGKQRLVDGRRVDRIRAPGKALAEAAQLLVEQLGFRLQLERKDEACDAIDSRRGGESS